MPRCGVGCAGVDVGWDHLHVPLMLDRVSRESGVSEKASGVATLLELVLDLMEALVVVRAAVEVVTEVGNV